MGSFIEVIGRAFQMTSPEMDGIMLRNKMEDTEQLFPLFWHSHGATVDESFPVYTFISPSLNINITEVQWVLE